jgi:hypothetical protein
MKKNWDFEGNILPALVTFGFWLAVMVALFFGARLFGLLPAAEGITAPTCTLSVNEQSTGALQLTLCDGVGVQDPNCTALGLTGAMVDPNDWTELRYWEKIASNECEVLAETSVDPNSNPFTVVFSSGTHAIVGKCSGSPATCCVGDPNCAAGQHCVLPRGQAVQYNRLTMESTWVGGGQLTAEYTACVTNLANYP